MKSYSLDINRDTKIPKEEIALIIAHWYDKYYYGGGLTVLDLRKYLESKLRTNLHSREAVKAWIKGANDWEYLTKLTSPGKVENLLCEYFQIKLVA